MRGLLMQRSRPATRVIAILSAWLVLLVGGLAGAAFAYWTTGGGGSGSASTDSVQPVVVTAFVGGDAPSSTLLPGGPAADVILRLSNPNNYAVVLMTVARNSAVTGCVTPAVTFTDQSNLNVTI